MWAWYRKTYDLMIQIVYCIHLTTYGKSPTWLKPWLWWAGFCCHDNHSKIQHKLITIYCTHELVSSNNISTWLDNGCDWLISVVMETILMTKHMSKIQKKRIQLRYCLHKPLITCRVSTKNLKKVPWFFFLT